MKIDDRKWMDEWEQFADNIRKSTPVDQNETREQKVARIARLEANDEEWFKYYFPKFYSSEPAPFHIAATRRVMLHPEWYEVRAWSRELAKSTRSMMEDLKLLLTKKKKFKLLISNSWDNAWKLMIPYVIHLEVNDRITHDYGSQPKHGSWVDGDITTRTGFSIRAVGAGQSPRGARKEETRPDIIEFDDFDTDEECLNGDIIDKKWEWVNKAVIPTRSVSQPTLIRWNGNLIAEDCCIQRAIEFADHVDVINIRDEENKSTWPEKNTEEFIDRVLATIPYSAQQQEYFNNPFREGKIFKEMVWGEVPPLNKFRFLVAYADPSTSNKDKNAAGKTSGNSCKAVVLVGKLELKYYIIKSFVDVTTNSNFMGWLYQMDDLVRAKNLSPSSLYTYIENNTLQDPFYQQVLMPLLFEEGKKRKNILGITPDDRKKPEKFFRIEGTLEPLNRLGCLILNIAEKDNPHMKRLESQFKSVSPNSKTMDAPDAVEGAVNKIKEKDALLEPGMISTIKRTKYSKRF